jgi:rubrerythrin
MNTKNDILAAGNDSKAMLQAAAKALKQSMQDETALVVYSCLSGREVTWQRVVGQLINNHPQNSVARGWAKYMTFFNNPAGDATLQEALRRLLTYADDDYTYADDPNKTILNDLVDGQPSHSIFEWAAVADAARLQLGQAHPHANHLAQSMSESLHQEAQNYLEAFADGQDATTETVDDSANVYEMFWDCKYCGTTKLLGKTQKFCPTCGAPQDPDRRYFPADDEKVAVKDHKFVGADKKCASCGNLNSAAADHCTRCGAPMADAESVRKFGERAKAEGETFAAQDLYQRLDQESVLQAQGIDPAAAAISKAAAGRRFKSWQMGLAALAVLVICGGLIYTLFFWTEVSTASVVEQRWEREIRIEQVQSVQHDREGRCSSVAPSDAYNESERREQVDTRRVQTGEICRNVQLDQGDGTFRTERQCDPVYENEPVYGPVCYYTVNEWEYERTVTSAGAFDQAMFWPEVSLARANCAQPGCEREAERDDNFIVTFTREGETFDCEVDNDMWSSVQEGQEFTVEIARVGGREQCDTLQPAG